MSRKLCLDFGYEDGSSLNAILRDFLILLFLSGLHRVIEKTLLIAESIFKRCSDCQNWLETFLGLEK